MKGLKIAFGITGGLTFLFLLFPGLSGSFMSPAEQGNAIPEWLSSALIRDREGMLRGDALRSLLFIALGAGTLLALHYEKIKKEYAIVLLGLLFLFDMFLVDKRYMNSDKFVTPSAAKKAVQPSPADLKILEDKSIFRVFNLAVSPFNDFAVSSVDRRVSWSQAEKISGYDRQCNNEGLCSLLFCN
jgi:hypothetical protein